MEQTRELPLFPLNTVLFPGMSLPLHIFEERYKLMISECVNESRPFGVVLIRTGSEVGTDADVHEIGTTAHITQVEPLGDGRMNIAALGFHRFRIHSTHNDKPYLTGVVEDFPLEKTHDPRIQKAAKPVATLLQGYLSIFAKLGNLQLEMEALPEDAPTLAFLTAIILKVPNADKQRLLSTPDLLSLLNTERKMLHREIHIMKFLIENGMKSRDDASPFSLN